MGYPDSFLRIACLMFVMEVIYTIDTDLVVDNDLEKLLYKNPNISILDWGGDSFDENTMSTFVIFILLV